MISFIKLCIISIKRYDCNIYSYHKHLVAKGNKKEHLTVSFCFYRKSRWGTLEKNYKLNWGNGRKYIKMIALEMKELKKLFVEALSSLFCCWAPELQVWRANNLACCNRRCFLKTFQILIKNVTGMWKHVWWGFSFYLILQIQQKVKCFRQFCMKHESKTNNCA